jgi:hypothetical protein
MSKCGGCAKTIANGIAGLTTFVAQRAGRALALTPAEVVIQRLSLCVVCEHRREHHCQGCGCLIVAKAGKRGERCPEGKW